MNPNVPDDAKYRKFTDSDQIVHVLGEALIQTHGLQKDIKLFGQEGKTQHKKRYSNIMTCKLTTLWTPPN